ncbi:MAG TPA: hypothetical protein ENH34_04235 [Phycisphaerales bacterium]|nr:hypothetical protein [Phycisphaerales bacterium]
MIDLIGAINCVRVMKEYGTYESHKIGSIHIDVNGLTSMISGVPDYHEGQIVLFRDELHPSDSKLVMGEYRGMEQRPTGKVTIKSPLTQKEIDKQKSKGSLLTTVGVMVGVPRKYIEEIRI